MKKKTGPKPAQIRKRFFNKVLLSDYHPDDCWEWIAGKRNGYGMLYNHETNGPDYAHRVSYRLFKGPIPEGMEVCHTCDCKGCVNPNHLFLGTHEDNLQDASAKGIMKRGEAHPRGKLTEAQAATIIALRRQGMRPSQIRDATGLKRHFVSDIIYGKCWQHLCRN